MFDKFLKLIRFYTELKPEDIDFFKSHIPINSFKKNELIFREGKISKTIYFILKGCVRLFYNVDGNEKTAFFYTEGKFVCAGESYTFNIPAKENYQAIEDTGIIKLDYTKRYLLGFASWGENAVFWKGKEIIQSTQTPYGKIGIAICRDFAFSSFIKQAAKSDVDIMLGPSYDWPKSFGPAYRTTAIENGFSFVRPTYNGVSHATDYNGNVIATMDSEKTEDGIMYVDVPTKGVKTLFPIVGNFLGWICVVGMLALIFIGKFGKKRKITNT